MKPISKSNRNLLSERVDAHLSMLLSVERILQRDQELELGKIDKLLNKAQKRLHSIKEEIPHNNTKQNRTLSKALDSLLKWQKKLSLLPRECDKKISQQKTHKLYHNYLQNLAIIGKQRIS